MKQLLSGVLIITFLLSSCSTLGKLGIKPTNLETVMALKGILDSSTFKAIQSLKNINDSGVESLLPPEIAPVLSTLRTIGYGDQVDQISKSIGMASKTVVVESEGIVKDAISNLKFSDAVAVVLGGEDAATNILKRAMYDTVKQRYSASMETELGKTEALQYWPMATGAYNMFSKNKVASSLPDFLAERAVDGLFIAIGKEEAKARTDYKALGNSAVTKVFDYYAKQK